jgi:amidase
MNLVTRDKLIYAMSSQNPPVLRVYSGDTITFETCDCFANQITSHDYCLETFDWERINPATGPVFVEEAMPGDTLEITVNKITIRDFGVMLTGPGLGVIGSELDSNSLSIVPIRDNQVHFLGLQLPVRPMIGVIGTAPAGQPVACGIPGRHGGNMDTKLITQTATLYLPVEVPGGLLAMGDLHAVMGDGEVSVSGVEVAGEVQVTVKVISGAPWPLPLLKNGDCLYTIASAVILEDAVHDATASMVGVLTKNSKISKFDAIKLLSIAGNLQISQVVDPLKTVRMELPLAVLAKLGIKI